MTALAARPLALIVAPVAAAALTIVWGDADPAPGAEGRELVEAYATDPDALIFKSLGFYFAYTLWLAAALGVVGLVHRRGSWLANVARVLHSRHLVHTRFLVSGFIDSAIGRLVGINETVRVGEAVEEQMGTSGHDGSRLRLPACCSPSPGGDRRLAVCAAAVMGSRVGNRGYGDFHPLRRNPARQTCS